MQETRKILVPILGMHRSGTSLLAQHLARNGVPLGTDLLQAASDNVDGFWEHRKIVEIQDALLASLLDERTERIWAPKAIGFNIRHHRGSAVYGRAKERLLNIAAAQFEQSRVFGFKDPRTSATLPLWKEIADALKCDVVFVVTIRHPAEVVASLRYRQEVERVTAELLWLRAMRDILSGLNESASRGNAWLFSYAGWFDEPGGQINALSAFLRALGLPDATDLDIARPELRHQRSTNVVLSVLNTVYELLSENSPGPLTGERIAAARAAIDGFVDGIGGWEKAHAFLAPAYAFHGGEPDVIDLPWPADGVHSAEMSNPRAGAPRLHNSNGMSQRKGPLFHLCPNESGKAAVFLQWTDVAVLARGRLRALVRSRSADAVPVAVTVRFSDAAGSLADYVYRLEPASDLALDVPFETRGDTHLTIRVEVLPCDGGSNHHAGAIFRRVRIFAAP